MLSIIIPTLNAAARLGAVLGGLRDLPFPAEVVVVDANSADATARIARAFGVRLVQGPPGRGRQLAAGAGVAAGDWFLFLHADTRLQAGWAEAAGDFMADPDRRFYAGYFRFALDDDHPAARRIEDLVAWRCRTLALPYGDQGLLISRAFHDHLGGFRPLVLMEDVDLVRRIGARRLVPLGAAAVTSAERYRRDGWWLRPARNLCCLGLYLMGLPPAWIARVYR